MSLDERETGIPRQPEVFARRPIARMFAQACGANEPAGQQEMYAGLKMRKVWHRHVQLATRRQDTEELCKRARLLIECQVFQHIEAERAVEG